MTYFQNRRKDLQDIVQVGVETPVYGAGVRVGLIPLGVYFAGGESSMGKRDLGKGIGLRGGEFGKYHSQQLVFGFLGGENFYSGDPMKDDEGKILTDKHGVTLTDNDRANKKSYKMRYMSLFNDPVLDRARRKKDKFRREYVLNLVHKSKNPALLSYLPEEDPKPFGYPSQFAYQVDAFVGVYGGVRVGVNFAELLDFVLGIATIDILDDDVASE